MTYSMHLFIESLTPCIYSMLYSIPETIAFGWGIMQMRFHKSKPRLVAAVPVILLNVLFQAYWNSVGGAKAKLFFMDYGPEWSYKACDAIIILVIDIIFQIGMLLLFDEKLIKGLIKIYFCGLSVGIFLGTLAEFLVDKANKLFNIESVSGVYTVLGIIMILCVAYFMKKQKELVRCIRDIPMMYYIVCIAFYMLLMEIPSVMRDFALTMVGGPFLGDGVELILFGYDLMSIIYTLLAVLIFMNMWRGQYKRENDLKDKYLKVSREYYNSMTSHMKEVRSIKHDMNAHVNALESYLESGDITKAKDYLAKMKEQHRCSNTRLINVGNELVSAVLSDIMKRSCNESVTLECEGVLPSKLQIEDFDLCTIFSNLINNSVEACNRLAEKEKKISLRINVLQNSITIVCENPIEWELEVNKLKGSTSKSDKANHGFGLYNIEKTISKYNGEMKLSAEDGSFIVKILLYQVIDSE